MRKKNNRHEKFTADKFEKPRLNIHHETKEMVERISGELFENIMPDESQKEDGHDFLQLVMGRDNSDEKYPKVHIPGEEDDHENNHVEHVKETIKQQLDSELSQKHHDLQIRSEHRSKKGQGPGPKP